MFSAKPYGMTDIAKLLEIIDAPAPRDHDSTMTKQAPRPIASSGCALIHAERYGRSIPLPDPIPR